MALDAEKPLPADCVVVGKIVSVYGIKGWVKLLSYTEPRENIFEYEPLWLENPKGGFERIELEEGRPHGQGLVAHWTGIDNRDQARSYCQRLILVEKSRMATLQKDEYYWHQLIGLKVFSQFEGKQVLLGVVKEMMETGANDVMKVGSCEGSVDARERCLPYLTGEYGIDVDLAKGCLMIDWDPEF